MQLKQIGITDIVPNTGQIEGLPANPRFIKDENFAKLVQSLKDLPSLTDARPVIVYPFGGKFVAIAGNMRSRAAKELKWKSINCAILPEDTPVKVLREIAIKDNVGFGENDWGLLTNEWDSTELEAWGMNIPNFGEILEDEEGSEESEPENKNIWVPDCLFESDNIFDIPTLRIDLQAKELLMPFKGWGVESRQKTQSAVWHFYVDDYRFEALWSNPEKIVNSGCTSIIEPNLSLYDTTPVSYGIHQIYKKRWLARLMQKFGITVFADLNVSIKFAEYNQMGIPEGWNAFCTRGYSGKETYLENDIKIAQKISGEKSPFMVVYGGGKSCKEIANDYNLIHVTDLMTDKKHGNHGKD